MIQWNAGGGSVNVSQTLTNPPGCTSPASATFSVLCLAALQSADHHTECTDRLCEEHDRLFDTALPGSATVRIPGPWFPLLPGISCRRTGRIQITIRWIDASNGPIFVKLKIERCYADSVMFPVNLLGLHAGAEHRGARYRLQEQPGELPLRVRDRFGIGTSVTREPPIRRMPRRVCNRR